MATVVLKSSIRHLSMLHTDCYHVIIGIKPCHQNGLTASGKYVTAPDRFPRADWQHKFLVTGLNPLSNTTSEIASLPLYILFDVDLDGSYGICPKVFHLDL